MASKRVFLILSFLIMLIFIISCVPQMSNEELDALSDEEFATLMEESEDQNIAGEAGKFKIRKSGLERRKPPLLCEDDGEQLTFTRGTWSRSLPKFFCSVREGNQLRERVCRTSGYTSRLTTCEYGCEDGACAEPRLPSEPEFPWSDEREIIPVELSEGNMRVFVPEGYEPYGEKFLEDLQYCFGLVPSFVGIGSYWGGIIAKVYVSNDDTNMGFYNRNGWIVYKRSQENFDMDLDDVLTNNSGGFLYFSSPTYCANTHEFTHYVVTHMPLPGWANEGIAEYSQKFNQPGSKDDTECEAGGFYSGDPWETGEVRRFFDYSDLSEDVLDEPGGRVKWYHSAMCFWELFDLQFGEESRKSAFRTLREDYTGERGYRNETRVYDLLSGEELFIPDESAFFIEEILFEIVSPEELAPLLNLVGFEEGTDYNLD